MRNAIRAIFVALLLATLPLAANAEVFVSVSFGPPALPVYVAPPIPAPGYIWTPGYWAWDGDEYYWVPGTWVLAPAVGLLWTPGYWGWASGFYAWHAGYWGPHVGFYGGIDYGCGYGGFGYHGGYWRGDTFIVNNTVINQTTVNRVAFNGGSGGVAARPTAVDLQAAHERHLGMSDIQRQHEVRASRDTTMRASFNHGRPPVAATQKPGVFYGHGVVAARAGGPVPMQTHQTTQTAHAGGAPAHAGPERRFNDRPAQASRPTVHEPPGNHVGTAPSARPGLTAHAAPPAHTPPPAHTLPPARTGFSDRPAQAPRPMTQEQPGGHAGAAPPARNAYSGGGFPAARGSYPSGGHGGFESSPRGAPVNAHPQGHVGERPAGRPPEQRPQEQRPQEHGRPG
jgi:hypothetical protein